MTYSMNHKSHQAVSFVAQSDFGVRCRKGARLLALSALCLGFLSGCKKSQPEDSEKAAPAASGEAGEKPVAKEAKSPQPAVGKAEVRGYPKPIGPPLVVVPGVGLSAIRFGATFETVERHMGAPCDIRTETRCAYVRQAVDFSFKDGVVSHMRVERRDRPVKNPAPDASDVEKVFGTFNGLIRPDIRFFLHRHIVIEEFGEPKKKEPLKGADGQVEKHIYDGLILEYDKIENGNVVLAAIDILPDPKAPVLPKLTQKPAEGAGSTGAKKAPTALEKAAAAESAPPKKPVF